MQEKHQDSRSTTRFAPPVSPGKMTEICNGYVPPTTVRATNWAVRVLDEWREECNKRCSKRCPSDLLEHPAAETLNLWLARFVVEARRADGDPYPPTTIVNLLSGLYWFAKNCDCHCSNFMDQKNPAFKKLTRALLNLICITAIIEYVQLVSIRRVTIV